MITTGPPPAPGPAGIYLHFPFCARRCSYCDFPTVVGRSDHIAFYLRALEQEIARFQPELPRQVDTVYLGGGTPSLMAPGDVARLLEAIEQRFDLSEDREVTLECNPETVDGNKLAAFRASGVTRVGIGVQSLDDAVLDRAGRTHDGRRALRAARQAREVGGLQLSVDLIAGLPGERLQHWSAALDAGRDPLVWEDPWDARRRLDEALIMGLRLARGLDTERLGQRYEVNLRQVYRAAWDRGAAAGLIRWNGPRVRLTRRGRICSNELFAELLAA